MDGKRIELISDPSLKGTIKNVEADGMTIIWDDIAPDYGCGKIVIYTDIEGTWQKIREVS
ncbi:hypothetical protein [Gorillibacterium sp. sgz5001074]|uniref:hypothetical protein n=1 Tax=Gorillibacterium sp. sgz5001074 TaxID=3446695 RepID=UPI003F67928A